MSISSELLMRAHLCNPFGVGIAADRFPRVAASAHPVESSAPRGSLSYANGVALNSPGSPLLRTLWNRRRRVARSLTPTALHSIAQGRRFGAPWVERRVEIPTPTGLHKAQSQTKRSSYGTAYFRNKRRNSS